MSPNRSKKKTTLTLFYSLVLVALGVVITFSYIYVSDAPIANGTVDYGIQYKKDRKLDIYYPISRPREKSPVIIYVHGGAWIAGRKEAVNLNRIHGAMKELRNLGYTIISPSYTLATKDKSPFPHCIVDVFDALQWTNESADSLSLDTSNISIIGESAGGHIALLCAYAAPSLFGLPYQKTSINKVIAIYAPSDLKGLYKSPIALNIQDVMKNLPQRIQRQVDLVQVLFGFDPQKDTLKANRFAEKYSPISYINKTSPRTLIIHGNEDCIVPYQQSIDLSSKLHHNEIENKLKILEGIDHAFRGINSAQKDSVQQWISAFVLESIAE